MSQAQILSIKRWEKTVWHPGDDENIAVHMELKRLQRNEAKALQKAVATCLEKLAEVRGNRTDEELEQLSRVEQAQMLSRTVSALDVVDESTLREWFGSWVRRVEGLDVDGNLVTTGAGLYEEADDALILFVLLNLFHLSKLKPHEIKASASPSTSQRALAPATGDGCSRAMSTEGEAGPTPSTVTEIQAEVVSSSLRE